MVIVTSPWTAAPATPRTSSLLDHAKVVERSGHFDTSNLGVSYNCLDVEVDYPLCFTEDDDKPVKDFGEPGTIPGFDFAVYGGIVCRPFGFSLAEAEERVEEAFLLRESAGVERRLMDTRFRAEGGTPALWPAPDDVTPSGGAVTDIRSAIAMLEGLASTVYSGQPTIHLPVQAASLAASRKAIVSEGGKFYTRLGAKVAVGAGYQQENAGPDGTAPGAGVQWLYVTGDVTVARSEVVVRAELDRNTNDQFALAERLYTVAIDCFAAAVQVNVE